MISGLGPYIEYKDSGSRWLGLIPSGWEVRKLRTLIRRRNERNRVDLPLLSVAREKGVFVRSLTDPDENHNVIPDDLSNYKVARTGSLVINKMKAWQGSMGIAPCDGIDGLLRSRPYISNIICRSTGLRASRLRLYPDEFFRLPIILPPAEEQHRIVASIRVDTAEINTAILRLEREIDLLSEYRMRLTADVVTGKVDVRKAAAALPDEDLNPDNVGTGDSVEADEEGEEFAEEVLAD